MSKLYSERFCLRMSDFDCRGKIKPSAILDLFQEVASSHAETLGAGFEDLLRKNLLWVIVKIKYDIVGKIKMHTAVNVKTWPIVPKGAVLSRDYLIEDEEGNVLVKGTSDWVTIDAEKRKIVVPDKDIYGFTEFLTERAYTDRMRKIPDFESNEPALSVIPTFCDLDLNGHVNNIKYADFVLNALQLGKDEEIKSFRIDYHREVKRSQELFIHISRSENDCLAKGIDSENNNMFTCHIELK